MSSLARLAPASTPPLRIYRTPGGFALYGSDAEVAGPILGLRLQFPPIGDFTGFVTIDPGTLAAAVAELERGGESVRVVG